MGFFSKIKEKLGPNQNSAMFDESAAGTGYVELGNEAAADAKSKIMVRPFVVDEFESIKPILDALREGHTIALINIKPLKDKDLVELKRAINKIKKTTDALEGDIAGFGDNWIAACPSFAAIYRGAKSGKAPRKEMAGEDMEGMKVTEYEE
jgi:SepF-like predicted cell division protein (DUF552 family)